MRCGFSPDGSFRYVHRKYCTLRALCSLGRRVFLVSQVRLLVCCGKRLALPRSVLHGPGESTVEFVMIVTVAAVRRMVAIVPLSMSYAALYVLLLRRLSSFWWPVAGSATSCDYTVCQAYPSRGPSELITNLTRDMGTVPSYIVYFAQSDNITCTSSTVHTHGHPVGRQNARRNLTAGNRPLAKPPSQSSTNGWVGFETSGAIRHARQDSTRFFRVLKLGSPRVDL